MSVKQADIDEIEQRLKEKFAVKKEEKVDNNAEYTKKLELPSIKKELNIDTKESNGHRDSSANANVLTGPKTNKGVKYKTGFNSINNTPKRHISKRDSTTLIPTTYNRHKDLLNDDEDLSGLSAQNEWDEIWKFAKIKELEENAIKRHNKLAQKIKFNSDLRAQIMDNQKRKRLREEEEKQQDVQMMQAIQKRIKREDNK